MFYCHLPIVLCIYFRINDDVSHSCLWSEHIHLDHKNIYMHAKYRNGKVNTIYTFLEEWRRAPWSLLIWISVQFLCKYNKITSYMQLRLWVLLLSLTLKQTWWFKFPSSLAAIEVCRLSSGNKGNKNAMKPGINLSHEICWHWPRQPKHSRFCIGTVLALDGFSLLPPFRFG